MEGAIAYASAGKSPHAGDLARLDIEASRRPGEPIVRVTAGDLAGSTQPAGGLVGEVDKAIRFAADSQVVAVVGPGGSREALQTAPIYRDAKLPNLNPTSTSRLLRSAGPWTFRLAADDSIQGQFIGEFVAHRLKSSTALLFYIPDEYGLGLASGIRAALPRRGVRLLGSIPIRQAQPCPSLPEENGYEDIVTAALSAGAPDAVVLATRGLESSCLIRSLTRRSPGIRFVAGDGTLVDSAFIARIGAAADSLYVVAFWHPEAGDTASQSFVARFRAIVGRLPRHDDAMYYDAVMLLARAIRAVGADREAIREYLDALGGSRPPYPGITGPIAFRPGSRRPLLMTRVRGPGLEVVTP